ncbi:HprK-related kinase B [Aliiruegeria haliotis]|uniref:HprK-related kinase B n=1 Tax=Aliiruegeria haliotis TaxID=1280846 RepID=A0A2T0RIA9_9RHOB|nr:HprK-related kinase B [Aliiruegeria haliotis]PRY20946.1 HprK-related kinase B [Aliiruegeria haliotis]
MTPRTVAEILARLDLSPLHTTVPLFLEVGHLRAEIRCNEPLRSELEVYFADVLAAPGTVNTTVEVLDGQQLDPAPRFVDWAREPGKAGRKDAILDLCNARLIHKVRTGVTFLQSADRAIAFGPTAQNPNQVINFVNTQLLNICQRDGWQICHAAAATNGTRTLAIAGLSGGGKSTAVLHMMDRPAVSFVTNDRLLVRAGTPVPEGLGIAKMPRINPGTILHNPRLHPLLSATRRAALDALPSEELWHLEEKYDLPIRRIYGADRIRLSAPLTHIWVLNWARNGDTPTRISPVLLEERPDLLAAIMKSPGPFYQKPDGRFLRDIEQPEPEAYLSALAGVAVSEVTGGIDFDALQHAGAGVFGS